MNAARLGIAALVVVASVVLGPARVTASETTDWHDEAIYMVMTDRFRNGDPSNDGDADPRRPDWWHGGDLQGVIDELAYIKGLGMTAIWITPVTTQQRGGYHGYWTVDFYTVDPHLGDIAKLRELVTKAHAIGLKVVLDVVLNHMGQGTTWLTDGAHRGWFHDECPMNFADEDSVQRCWLAGLPDLNTENAAVRDYLREWALWIADQSGVDGFRLDAARHLPKDFLAEISAALKARHPGFWLLGEVFTSGYRYQSGFLAAGLDAVTDFQTYESVGIGFAKNGNVSQITLPPSFASDLGSGNEDRRVTFIDNHDVARFVGADPPDTDTRARLAQALVYLYTVPGVPVLYYGTEIALPGGRDPDDRRSMPWDGSSVSATRDLVTRLAALRHESVALRRGSFVELVSERSSAAYARVQGDERVVIVVNGDPTGSATVRVPLKPLGLEAASASPLLSAEGALVRSDSGVLEVGLPTRGYTVLKLEPVQPPWPAIVAAAAALAAGVGLLFIRGARRGPR